MHLIVCFFTVTHIVVGGDDDFPTASGPLVTAKQKYEITREPKGPTLFRIASWLLADKYPPGS